MSSLSGLNRPTLDEIRSRVQADVETNLPGKGVKVAYSPLNAISESLAALAHEMYGYLSWVSDQTNVEYCEDENLDIWGSTWGIDRKQPSFATGDLTFTGTNGVTISAGKTLITPTGLTFKTTTSGTISGGSVTVTAQSMLPGKDYNLQSGVTLTLTSPIAQVGSEAITGEFTGGSDLESDDSYRARIKARIKQNGNGGSANDYVTWALLVPGVTRAWVTTREYGPMSVVVRFAMDDIYPNGIPLAGDITTVNAAIQAKKPILSNVIVQAPALRTIDLTINGLSPVTQEIKDNIAAELTDLFKTRSAPGATIYYNWIYTTISLTSGVEHFTITNPTTNILLGFNEIAALGTITYT